MSKETIAVFEDDPQVGPFLAKQLSRAGYAVILVMSMDDLDDDIERIESAGVKVAIVDGNLSKGRNDKNEHGRQIVARLRMKGVKSIGYPGAGQIEGADVNLLKGDRLNIILATIARLLAE